ncbi:MAG TPA: DMT family transporter [Vicinamibacterales bacterium]|nr:DMT family transporter [Vicinamibacterales bacterium]
MRTGALTAAALVAFASNSLLCRMALSPPTIDAASFATIRFAAGACCLAIITAMTRAGTPRLQGSWRSAIVLFVYAIPFSYAYGLLTTGTGALILFGTVQVTMMLAALVGGERPHARQWVGLVLAVAGLVYLVLPGLAAPSPLGATLMAVAGVAWGLYSLLGRGAADPLAQNASNFVRTIPLTLVVSLATWRFSHLETRGIVLAVISGAVTSGLGYVAWYAALRQLSATRASLVQLLVPVLAAAGGVVVLSETLSLRLVLSAAIVIGGIALALTANERRAL